MASLKKPEEPKKEDFEDDAAYNAAKSEYENKLSEYNETIKKLQNEIKDLQEKSKELSKAIDNIDNLQGEIDENAIKEAEEAIAHANDYEKINSAQEKSSNRQLTNYVSVITSKIDEFSSKIADLQAKINKLSAVQLPILEDFFDGDDFNYASYETEMHKYMDAQKEIAEIAKEIKTLAEKKEKLEQFFDKVKDSAVIAVSVPDDIAEILGLAEEIQEAAERSTKDAQKESSVKNEKANSTDEVERYKSEREQIALSLSNYTKQLAGLMEEIKSKNPENHLIDFINSEGEVDEDGFAAYVQEYLQKVELAGKIQDEIEALTKRDEELQALIAKHSVQSADDNDYAQQEIHNNTTKAHGDSGDYDDYAQQEIHNNTTNAHGDSGDYDDSIDDSINGEKKSNPFS